MQTIKPVRSFLLALLFCLSLASCKNSRGLHYEPLHSANGWGYNIVSNDRILIHQESVPGEADNIGFDTQAQAEAMARLVMQKIKQGGLPTVTDEEVIKIKGEGN